MNSRSLLRQPRLFLFSLAGSLLAGAASSLGSISTQVAVLGVLVSLLFGATLALIEKLSVRDASIAELAELARTQQQLLSDQELSDCGHNITKSLIELSRHKDAVLRTAASAKLTSIVTETRRLARGTITFQDTESWRNAYAQLLSSDGVTEYRSAAWVKLPSYWQDPAGRRSMQANFDAVERGVRIERVAILPATLWPAEQLPPVDAVLSWLVDQQRHGVRVLVCLEEDIDNENDLPMDFGVYGERAVGVQRLDDRCRTESFELIFNEEAVRLAMDRWRRLELYATPLSSLLDQNRGNA